MEASDNQIPSSPGRQRCQIFGECPRGGGGVLKLRFHRYIRFSYKQCNFSRICLLVKMASKTVTTSILRIIVKGTTNDSRLGATQSTKEQRFETKQSQSCLWRVCWCNHSFSLHSLSNVIIIHMSLVALNKYDWQNFIQQRITRKVKKQRADTHMSALVQWYVYFPPPPAPLPPASTLLIHL